MEYRSDFIQIVRLCVLYEALVNMPQLCCMWVCSNDGVSI